MKQIKVTLKKSISGRIPKHRGAAKGLGLRKLHQTVVVADNPQVRGMLKHISYLVDVQEK